MTQYFDRMGERVELLTRTGRGDAALAAELEELDTELVRDVSVCSEFDGFPADVRDLINKTVLRRSAACHPVNGAGPCYETSRDHIYGILSLIGDLHTLFHEVAERRLSGFSDDPRTPLRILYARSDGRREMLCSEKRPDDGEGYREP